MRKCFIGKYKLVEYKIFHWKPPELSANKPHTESSGKLHITLSRFLAYYSSCRSSGTLKVLMPSTFACILNIGVSTWYIRGNKPNFDNKPSSCYGTYLKCLKCLIHSFESACLHVFFQTVDKKSTSVPCITHRKPGSTGWRGWFSGQAASAKYRSSGTYSSTQMSFLALWKGSSRKTNKAHSNLKLSPQGFDI